MGATKKSGEKAWVHSIVWYAFVNVHAYIYIYIYVCVCVHSLLTYIRMLFHKHAGFFELGGEPMEKSINGGAGHG